jgi:predicted nuclease of predicted toxin-antitoxin system
MKFLVDAQLPRRFCLWLNEAGHDAIHTFDLPLANRTPDAVILEIAEREGRIVVSKDNDFVQSHLLANRPPQLLLVSTGNIANKVLEGLLRANLDAIARAFETARFVEITRESLVIHD